MGYRGRTFQYPCVAVGFNANTNIDQIPPESMVHPSRNVNLHEGGIGKRGGTSHFNSAAIVDTSTRIMGGHDFILQSGVQTQVAGTSDGKIVTVTSSGVDATLKTGLGLSKVTSFEQMNNTLFVTNGSDAPQTWDGSAGSTSALGNLSADWTGTNMPKQFVKHGRGNSERMWAFGVAGFPNDVYYAAANTGIAPNFSTGGNIYIETGNAFGIVGGMEWQDRLFAFGKKKTYIIDDTDASAANWGYEAAAWEGGAASHRLVVKTPNDVVAMMEDGEIYSATAVQSYGDYKQASITRPSFMHNWIKEHVRLSYIDDFHAIYDPVLRAIKFFVVRAGQTKATTALVYFIDRPPDKAWSIHEGTVDASGYSAACSWLRRNATGDYSVFTGDYAGFVWKLEVENRNDNSVGYYGGIKTPNLTLTDPRVSKFFDTMRLITQAQGNYNLNINIWVDGVSQTSSPLTVSLAGSGSVLDTGTLGSFILGGADLIDVDLPLGLVGKRFAFEIYNSGVNQDFFLSNIMLDFRPLANLPA